MSRTLTFKTGGWFLALREREELGPYPTANSARNASLVLDARLRAMDASSEDRVIQSFVEQQLRLLKSVASANQ
jgi:hypothetical protein